MTVVRIPAADLPAATEVQQASYLVHLIREAERLGAWRQWLKLLFPEHFTASFAPHHAVLGEWLWALELGVKPDPLVVGLARGGGKSAMAEAGVAMAGCRGRRRFVLYVSGTQAKADRHVESIAGLLESRAVALAYPEMGEPKVSSVTGLRRSWKRQRLTTVSGFTVEGLGLDVGIRGAKLDETRPDGLALDDIDDEDDTPATTEAKIDKLTTAILPAGTSDLAVLGVQNVVHARSIFARLLARRGDEPWLDPDTEPADFLANREVVGPVGAIDGMAYAQQTEADGSTRYRITEGTATWEGQGLDVCQAQIDEWGITAFLREAQHETKPRPGGMFSHIPFAHTEWTEDLEQRLVRTVVACDPAVSNTDRSDSYAVQASGIDGAGVIFHLRSWEQRSSPTDAIRQAFIWAADLGAETIIIETDQGGDTWGVVFNSAWEELVADPGVPQIAAQTVRPRYHPVKAGSTNQSKEARAQEMQADYERPGRIVHVTGYHAPLEAALHRFPRTKPHDLTDATVHAWRWLRGRSPEAAQVESTPGAVLPGATWGASRPGWR